MAQIALRNKVLEAAEITLRNTVRGIVHDLQVANVPVFKGAPAVSYRATQCTKRQILQLLQDRITETLTDEITIHRY